MWPGLNTSAGELEPEWVRKHFPALEFDTDEQTRLINKIWNPERREQFMHLNPQQGVADVSWPHCQQKYGFGQAEDFSSWDDDSQPWPVGWNSWALAWLKTLARADHYHVRPGKDPLP